MPQRSPSADLLPGTLDLLILKAVSLGPLHGYGVLLRIGQISGGALAIEQGALYPALFRLERQGLLAAEWGVSENNRRAKAFRELLGTAPTPGTNTILITHKPNIIDALGKDWFDVKEGEASIFRPENGSYRLIARVQMEDWAVLAAAAK